MSSTGVLALVMGAVIVTVNLHGVQLQGSVVGVLSKDNSISHDWRGTCNSVFNGITGSCWQLSTVVASDVDSHVSQFRSLHLDGLDEYVTVGE